MWTYQPSHQVEIPIMSQNSVTIAFGVLAIIVATLLLLILPYHIKVRNAGECLFLRYMTNIITDIFTSL